MLSSAFAGWGRLRKWQPQCTQALTQAGFPGWLEKGTHSKKLAWLNFGSFTNRNLKVLTSHHFPKMQECADPSPGTPTKGKGSQSLRSVDSLQLPSAGPLGCSDTAGPSSFLTVSIFLLSILYWARTWSRLRAHTNEHNKSPLLPCGESTFQQVKTNRKQYKKPT